MHEIKIEQGKSLLKMRETRARCVRFGSPPK